MSEFLDNGERNPHPYVKVVWLDSGMHIDHGWNSQEKYLEDASLSRMQVLTVGVLMDKNDDITAVGLNYDATHDAWIGVQLIATKSIISMEYLNA